MHWEQNESWHTVFSASQQYYYSLFSCKLSFKPLHRSIYESKWQLSEHTKQAKAEFFIALIHICSKQLKEVLVSALLVTASLI